MARKKIEDNTNSAQSFEKVGAGAFVRTATISDISDNSNYPNADTTLGMRTIGKNGFEPELCLTIMFKEEGYDKEQKMMVFGKYKRNKAGNITAWDPWNNNVQRLLYKLLGDQAEVDEDLSIPNDVLLKLIGKEFKFVNYITSGNYTNESGEERPNHNKWGKIFSTTDPLDAIEQEWNENLPYLKDYAPERATRTKESNNFDPSRFAPDDAKYVGPSEQSGPAYTEEPLI